MEVLAGVFAVVGIVAVGARFAPRTPTGQVRLPRIVDESIGMWALRSVRSRLAGHPSSGSPPEPAVPVASIHETSALSDAAPTATSRVAPALPAAAPGAAPAPAGVAVAPGPWLADPAVARFAATSRRLAAAGVRPVPRWVGPAPAPAPWSPRVSSVPALRPPLQPRPDPGPTSAGPFVLSPADPPTRFRSPVEPVLPPTGRRAAVPPGWTPRRAGGPMSAVPAIATAPSRGSGLARLRATGTAVATTLTFVIVALVALASVQAPGRSHGEVLGATGRPEATVHSGQASAQPSPSASVGATSAPSRSKAKPTPTTRP